MAKQLLPSKIKNWPQAILGGIGTDLVGIAATMSTESDFYKTIIALKNEVGCGTSSQGSSSSTFSGSWGSGSDPIGNLIGSLFG